MNTGDKQTIEANSKKYQATKQRYDRAKATFEKAQNDMAALELKLASLRQVVLVHGGQDLAPVAKPAATPPQYTGHPPMGSKKTHPHLHTAEYQQELEQEIRNRNEIGFLPEPSEFFEWTTSYTPEAGWLISAQGKKSPPKARVPEDEALVIS